MDAFTDYFGGWGSGFRVGVWGLGFKVKSIPEIEHFLVLGRMLRVVVEPEFGFRVWGLEV